MDWNALSAFVRAEAPDFAASLQGVAPEAVERVEQESGVRLPLNYRQFVTTMGIEAAGFYLFGPGHSQKFNELAAELPAETYPGHRYFKIAFPVDESAISPPDYFLDLSRSDGVDAAVVVFEDVGDFRPENVRDLDFTFGEQVARRLFTFLVLERALERATVVLGSLTRAQGEESKREILALLDRAGFSRVLPQLLRVGCLRRRDVYAMVDEHAEGLSVVVSLGSQDAVALTALLDQLRDRFPQAAMRRPGGFER